MFFFIVVNLLLSKSRQFFLAYILRALHVSENVYFPGRVLVRIFGRVDLVDFDVAFLVAFCGQGHDRVRIDVYLNVNHFLLIVIKSVCISTALQLEVLGIERKSTFSIFNQQLLFLLSLQLRFCSSL